MWSTVVTVFFLWRFNLLVIAWLGSILLPFVPRFPYSDMFLIPSELPRWVWSFGNFDGVHYIAISSHGYAAKFTQVFFPLFPLTLLLVNRVFPTLATVLAGLIIANVLFFATLSVLAYLLRLDYSKNIAKWAMLFLVVFPTSFYFGSVYTESLFLFLVLFSFLAARKKWWIAAAVSAALATATRINGIFLLPALLWEQYQDKNFKFQISNFKKIFHSPILYIVPLGLIAYMVYLQFAFGDWLYFWHAQPNFGAERSGSGFILLPQVIFRYLKIFAQLSFFDESYWIAVLEFLSTMGCLGLLVFAHKKHVRVSYLIFSWLTVLSPTLTGTFSSMPRYVIAAFPMFIVLGMIQSSKLRFVLIGISTILLALLTILFTRGHWVA